jgi:hypothetical protein
MSANHNGVIRSFVRVFTFLGLSCLRLFVSPLQFDGSVIVLASPEDLTASAKAGRLDQELAEACLAMHKAKAEADAEARRLNPHLFPQE